MTECRSYDLRKHRAEGAARVCRGSGLDPCGLAAPTGDVAQFVNFHIAVTLTRKFALKCSGFAA